MISTKSLTTLIMILLVNVTICGCINSSDSNNDYIIGLIRVEFTGDINESQAYEIIGQYNLSITSLGGKGNNIIHCDVRVPDGKEEYYADILKENPNIEDARLFWEE